MLYISFYLILTSVYIQFTNADVVLLNIRNEQDTTKDLKLCALKKPYNNSDANIRYPLKVIGSNPCALFVDSTVKGSAEYIQLASQLSCSFDTFTRVMQNNDPGIILVGSNGPFRLDPRTNYDTSFVFFPEFMANELTEFSINNPVSSVLMTDATDKFDWSLIVIWLIAIAAVIVGALWTRLEFIKLMPKKREAIIENENNDDDEETARIKREKKEAKQRKKDEEDKSMITLSVGYLSILMLLIIVCGILLLLYFFYNIMIYFVYVLFAMGSSTAFYRIGCLILDYIPFGAWKFPKNNIPYLKDHRPEYRKILLAIASITISIIWFIYRHSSWIWIIQDLMAFSLSINALSYYRLETYKSITILLTVFFLYDIFMVFVTPQFTNGTSIMEAVAFGGKDSQQQSGQDWNNLQFTTDNKNENPINRLPVVITVPHLSMSKRLCSYYYEYSYSLLGLGDILIPGISANYGIIIDYSLSNRFPIYFLVNVLGYFIGLMLALVGLIFMNTAQPALLYLCPVLLLTSIFTSLLKGQFKEFWSGKPIKSKTSPKENKSFNEGNTTSPETYLEP